MREQRRQEKARREALAAENAVRIRGQWEERERRKLEASERQRAQLAGEWFILDSNMHRCPNVGLVDGGGWYGDTEGMGTAAVPPVPRTRR